MNLPSIAIITGSTRPGRNNIAVARWTYGLARQRTDAQFELVDIADYALPLLDEPMPAFLGKYTKAHTKAWSEKIGGFDGYIFVTPEYNHAPAAALKNAIDFLSREWNNKAAGFVAYGGSACGARAVEHLRLVMAELMVATVRANVLLSLMTDFQNAATFKPAPQREWELTALIDQVIAWASALRPLRDAPRTTGIAQASPTRAQTM